MYNIVHISNIKYVHCDNSNLKNELEVFHKLLFPKNRITLNVSPGIRAVV